MNTPRVNWHPRLTQYLAGLSIFRQHPFFLVDVGASGGIDGYWHAFGESLHAVGFDSLVNEVERLNAANRGSNLRYYANLVGDKSYVAPNGVPNTQPFPRTSAARAAEIIKCNYIGTYFDQTGTCVTATEVIELDDFLLRDHPGGVDFIKVDTDGSDYQVLRGARELLSSKEVLGVAVECQFHGLVHNESNTFRNIDRLLTDLGFSLFDLESYRYSRAVLPQPFVYRIPAQTTRGQVLACDALYLRDAGSPRYELDWSMTFPVHKLLKLVCLFEIFGLEDCGVELLLKHRAVFADLLNVDHCLDLLTSSAKPQAISYADYKRRFERAPNSFYPPE